MIANLLTIARNWAILIKRRDYHMAEFCLEYWNKLNGTNNPKWKYVLSWDRDLCENFGQWKRVVICEREWLLRFFPFLR